MNMHAQVNCRNRYRKTTIHEFEITRIALPEIDFRVVAAKELIFVL
jgi:hypothetical protein